MGKGEEKGKREGEDEGSKERAEIRRSNVRRGYTRTFATRITLVIMKQLVPTLQSFTCGTTVDLIRPINFGNNTNYCLPVFYLRLRGN